MKKRSLLIVLTFLSQLVFGQEKKHADLIEEECSIPFQLTHHNNLSVQAILNGKDTVDLMFHTAASSVALTEAATEKSKSLSFNGADSVKSWGGGGNSSRFSIRNVLRIGELEWNDVRVWEDRNSGAGTDGKFGVDLFQDRVIEIDFDKGLIILRAGLPFYVKNYEKLKLILENDFMFLESACNTGGKIVTNKFLLHSGYSGAVLLDDKFANENNIGTELKVVDEKTLRDSFGNVLKIKRAVLPVLIIGRETLPDVPVGFFEGAIGKQKMSILGGDILKRFNIIIDAKREYVYLQPNSLKGSGWYR